MTISKISDNNCYYVFEQVISTSVCYILVIYRGCADEDKLPYGVDAYKQCEYQAGSLWSFCEGDLCNDQQIGKQCSYKPKQYKASYGKSTYLNQVIHSLIRYLKYSLFTVVMVVIMSYTYKFSNNSLLISTTITIMATVPISHRVALAQSVACPPLTR